MPEPTGNLDSPLEIRLSLNVYTLDTLKKAAYRLINRMSVNFRTEGHDVICDLMAKKPQDARELLKQEFLDEVLDQDLRERVARETEAVRNAILGYAFSRTGLQGE